MFKSIDRLTFSTFSPAISAHFLCRLIHLLYGSTYQLSVKACICLTWSSAESILFSRSCDLSSVNTRKSIEARSGLYGGCSKISNPKRLISNCSQTAFLVFSCRIDHFHCFCGRLSQRNTKFHDALQFNVTYRRHVVYSVALGNNFKTMLICWEFK